MIYEISTEETKQYILDRIQCMRDILAANLILINQLKSDFYICCPQPSSSAP